MTLVNKYTSSYINENIVYQYYARLGPHLPSVCQQVPNYDILVYARYMQRPFQFNLGISTAKNLACVGHTPWYKNQQIPTKVPNPGVHLA